MGEFVDQHDLRFTRDDCVEVHFLEPLTAVIDASARNDLQTLEQRFGLLAAVGLDNPDDHVVAVFPPRPRGFQHCIGFADAGGGADENAQLAGATFLAPRGRKQGFRRRSMIA
jgi:hypothetical protein